MTKNSSPRSSGLILGRTIVLLLVLIAYVPAAWPQNNEASLTVIECRGDVKPRHEWNLRLRPGERLLKVMVAEGDDVQEGTPLAEVFDGEAWARLMDLQLRIRARFELKSKEARLNNLEKELAAQTELWNKVESDSAERRVAGLRDKRDELKEQVELLRQQVANPASTNQIEHSLAAALDRQISELKAHLATPVLRAPFAGRVAYCAPQPTRRTAGETVLKVWDTNVSVRAQILQHQLAYITPGCRAEVSLDFSSEKPVRGTVTQVVAQPETQPGETYPTFGVELTLDEPSAWLKSGMRVSVRIHLDKTSNNPIHP
jgi:multidrug resistance efflux pump